LVVYTACTNTFILSSEFEKWLYKLRDFKAKAHIVNKIDNATFGNFGHSKSVGGGISEIKIDMGPGHRIYYARKENTIYWLLNGGDKSTQQNDIKKAQVILKRLEGA
jgi:putative addiction module killer protein